MNLFKVRCKGCNTLYSDIVEKGKTALLHMGLASTDDKTPLPTPECIRVYDYVYFHDCGHCSPEVFEECRACNLGYTGRLEVPGQPTKEKCSCRYAIKKVNVDVPLGEITRKVINGKIEEALNLLLSREDNEDELHNNLLLQTFRLNQLETEKQEGVVSKDDYSVQKNKIAKTVIGLIGR